MTGYRDVAKPMGASPARTAINGAAAVLVFLFVWLVFDNLALALIFSLIAGGGAAAVQQAAKKADSRLQVTAETPGGLG